MSGNILRINDSSRLEWYIGDSEMDILIEHLDNIGVREHKDKMDMMQSWVDKTFHELARKHKVSIDIVADIVEDLEKFKSEGLVRKEEKANAKTQKRESCKT